MRRVKTRRWTSAHPENPPTIELRERDYRLMLAVVRAADNCFNKREESSQIKRALDAFNNPRKP